MARGSISGQVTADTIEVRYAWGGKVTAVNKRRGDRVKKGEVLASLDRTLLQKELERQLADYDKTRAEFEIFAKHHPNPGDDLTTYAKKIEQAQLDISVKDVEIAKLKLDQANLVCPVNGIVTDDGGNRAGLYVTPASNAFTVVDLDSVRVRIELDPEEVDEWSDGREVKVIADGRELIGKTGVPYPDGKKYILEVIPAETTGLTSGTKAEIRLQ